MPITYQIDQGRRLVIAAPSGDLTHQDIMGYQTEVWLRADVAGYDEIVDMTGVTDMAVVPTESVQMLAALSARMDGGKPSRFAIVAPDDHHFGVGRMYQTYRDAQPNSTKQTAVFRSREEALRWLGK